MIGLNLSGGKDMLEKIISANKKGIESQRDGIGGLLVNDGNEVIVERDLLDYKRVFDFVGNGLQGCKLFGLHSRQATTGEITEQNIHFGKVGNLIFAHNGWVESFGNWGNYRGYEYYANRSDYGYYNPFYGKKKEKQEARLGRLYEILGDCGACAVLQGKGELACKKHKKDAEELQRLEIKLNSETMDQQDELGFNYQDRQEMLGDKEADKKTDSQQFIEKLPKNLTREAIMKAMGEYRFTGVAFILDEKKKEFWIFSTREIDFQSDFKSYAVFFSFTPAKRIYEMQKFLGLDFPREKPNKIESFTITQGVYHYSYGKDIKQI